MGGSAGFIIFTFSKCLRFGGAHFNHTHGRQEVVRAQPTIKEDKIMPLTINTNSAAVTASYNLSRNNASLQKSLVRLSTGSRINKSSDDAGGLAVSMKLKASATRLRGVQNNIQNAISFLEVQDGVLKGSADILSRMGELKALSQDVLKNSADIGNYNAEFKNLQVQLYQMANEKFNGVSLFATKVTDGSADGVFNGTTAQDNTVSIFTSERGAAGPVVSLDKSMLLSAMTFTSAAATTSVAYGVAGSKTFGAADTSTAISLDALTVSFFSQALENVATLRADNGGTSSRLNFASDHASRTQANLEAANGRIVDVDIAEESTRLAKYNILVQASAAMLAQANTAPQTALMLLG
jgi:flagellin